MLDADEPLVDEPLLLPEADVVVLDAALPGSAVSTYMLFIAMLEHRPIDSSYACVCGRSLSAPKPRCGCTDGSEHCLP